MRVLIVTARYLPHRGGLETVVYHLTQKLDDFGHEILIVTNRYPRTLPAKEVIDGIPVKRLFFLYPQLRFLYDKRIDLLLGSFWSWGWTTWRLLQIINRFKPDIVNLHYVGNPAPFLLVVNSIFDFPLFVSLHGGDVDGEPYRSRFKAWLFRAVTERAEIVTACSQNLADQALELSEDLSQKLQVIHNGVEWERFNSADPYPHKRPYIAAVGQLVPHKGFELLINAFADIALKFPKVDLLIAGEGECHQDLKKLARSRNLAGRVHFIGRVDENKVASLLAGSLFVAIPSKREAFGIVALEGMAAGKSVLATPVGGIPEFLPKESNRLIPPRRSAWAESLDDWLSEKKDELDNPTNFSQAKFFDWKKVAERYLSSYSQALKKK